MRVVRLGDAWIAIGLACLCGAPPRLSAATQDYEGKPIGLIVFEPKEQALAPAELAEILPLKRKQPLRMKDVETAIERLYATGRYADIVVDAELHNGEVVLRFLTQNNWFVGPVAVQRVPQPPSVGQLVNATGLSLGAPFHEEDLRRAIEGLRQTLERNGFFESRVEPSVEYDSRTQQAMIRFRVEPGPRARFTRPQIQGNPVWPPDRLIRATRWKGLLGWRPVTETRLQQGLERIRRAYQKQDRLMAEVRLEKMDYDTDTRRARPFLSAHAGPVITVETEGSQLSRGRLRRLVPVFEERSADRDLIVEGAENLTEYFQNQGYFDTKVNFTTEADGPARQKIVYHIERGRRYKLVRVAIDGNRYFDRETIRERMLVTPASFQFRRGRFSQSLLERDLEAIRDLYRANGFRDVQVESTIEHDYRGKEGEVAVFLRIREGPQWFVSDLHLEGASPEHAETIRSMLQSAPGQPFSEANVAADRDNILAYYFNRGYPSASFEWSWRQAPEPERVELTFRIHEGPRRFVREVLIGGLEHTRPQIVHRRILLNPGEPISQSAMLETQRQLSDLGIFAKVDTAIQNPDGEEKYKYVLYQLEEARRYSVAVGVGAEIARIGGDPASLEAPGGKAGFSPRLSFNFGRLNFRGRGHTLLFRSRVSNLQQRALATYLAPQIRGSRNVDLSFTALYDDSRDVRTFTARRREGSVQLTHRWTRSRTLFYRFAFRRVSVGDVKIQPELIPLLTQPTRVGVLAATYVDDRRDDPTDSRRGTYNSLDLGYASSFFGSQTDFLRLVARNSTYHSLTPRLVLARTASVGLLATVRTNPALPLKEQDIPLPERFFAGGASTHRGFPENQAGPRDLLTGFPLGGKAMLLLSTELRFPLLGENLGAAVFHDAGNIYSRAGTVSLRPRQKNRDDFNYMVHALGFGIRYRTPVGPVRFDLAFAPNSPRFFGCQGTREQLLFGCPVQTEQRISRFQFHFSLGQTF